MEQVNVGVIQFRIEDHKKANLEKVEYWVNLAAKNGAEMVVLPEMFVCPYDLSYFPRFAERFPQGEALRLLSGLAKEHGIYLVGGSLPEEFDGKLYNSSFTFDPQG
ncbi:MAG: nitrilase-related carbon-nitrogen hydrolase, partial [Candidatus Caldatribacteriaceae bacterium]